MNTFSSLKTLLTIRGIIAILIGLFFIIWPGFSLVSMITFFGAFLVIIGIVNMIIAVASRRDYPSTWFYTLTESLVSLAIGLLLWVWPKLTIVFFTYLIALWLLLMGLAHVIQSYRLFKASRSGLLGMITGLFAIIASIYILVYPIVGTVAMAWLIGILAFIYGLFTLWFASQLKSIKP